tara:strand:+ start:40 stop:819 length:780 start_codon:yes stop_codon:yes gene_type:complete
MTETTPQTPSKPQQDQSKQSEQQIIDDILGNAPSQEEVAINLPSKNRFYTLKDPSKPISLRPMTFEDERKMMSNKNVNIDVLNVLLGRCVSNIEVGSLLQMDKLFLIMKLREISYGEEYAANITCNGCKRENEVKFELNQLPVNFIGDELSDPMTVELPILKKSIKVKLPRVADEGYFTNTDHAVNNLWRFVEEIDGHSEKSVIAKVIPQLPLQDAHALFGAMSAEEYGVDTNVRFACNYCSHTEVMELPITADFFTGK